MSNIPTMVCLEWLTSAQQRRNDASLRITSGLNINLIENTTWPWGKIYDHTKGLKANAQELMGDAKWFLGSIVNDQLTNAETRTAYNIYNYERGVGTIYTPGTANIPHYWVGKVALPYLTDYIYAMGGETRNACLNAEFCGNEDWIFWIGWTLTIYGSSSYQVYDITRFVDTNDVSHQSNVSPTIYLKTDVQIIDGDGTPENPYQLGLE